jgi:hypothetical protein
MNSRDPKFATESSRREHDLNKWATYLQRPTVGDWRHAHDRSEDARHVMAIGEAGRLRNLSASLSKLFGPLDSNRRRDGNLASTGLQASVFIADRHHDFIFGGCQSSK